MTMEKLEKRFSELAISERSELLDRLFDGSAAGGETYGSARIGEDWLGDVARHFAKLSKVATAKTVAEDLSEFCQARETWGKWEARIIDTFFDLMCPAPISREEVRSVLSALLSAEETIVEEGEKVANDSEIPFPVALDIVLKSAILGIFLKIRKNA